MKPDSEKPLAHKFFLFFSSEKMTCRAFDFLKNQ